MHYDLFVRNCHQVYLADIRRIRAARSLAVGAVTRCAIKKFKPSRLFPSPELPASSTKVITSGPAVASNPCLQEISVLKFISSLKLPDSCALTPTVEFESADYFGVCPVGRRVSGAGIAAAECLPSRRNIFELLHLLVHLHSRDIFHRDLRRDNLLLVGGNIQTHQSSSAANISTGQLGARSNSRLMLIDFGSCTRGRGVAVPYSGAFRQASVAVLRHLASHGPAPYRFSVADELESTVHTVFSWIFPDLVAESLQTLDPLSPSDAATAARFWQRWMSEGVWLEAVHAAERGKYVDVARLLCLVLPGESANADDNAFDVRAALVALQTEIGELASRAGNV